MSAKLVVLKFDSENNFKSLQISFDDDENGSAEAQFSEWFEGTGQNEKKDVEKSSRLIVKIGTKSDWNNIDLDLCAIEIRNTQIYPNTGKQNLLCYEGYDSESGAMNTSSFRPDDNQCSSSFSTEDTGQDNETGAQYLCPLEYSLEKVKENNARIMENIHMLNRTLKYTKKKEILDVVCPKSMRYPCNTCGKCYVYETGLKRHCSTRHAITEVQPRWQVVWTCIECFQVWPRQDLALKHSSKHGACSSTEECVREIKTSSLLQCEFCEKVYTSIPRLLRHSKVHTTVSNYECNACMSSFQSYKVAEQHWVLCPLLKISYSFSLPKMLLCNVCDRKFKNYEQLYNHRYKVGHFITKTYINWGNAKNNSILVYQCEICAHYFPSVAPLLYHRSQQHYVYEVGQGQEFQEQEHQ